MKILKGDLDHLDFAQPLMLSKADEDRLIEKFNELFAVVEVVKGSVRTQRLGDKIMFSSPWNNAEELALLLDLSKTTEELSKMLGRSHMSITMRRGWLIDVYMAFAQEKKLSDPLGSKKIEYIKQFLEERQEELVRKKERKKVLRKIEKEIKELQDKKRAWEAEEGSKIAHILKITNQISSEQEYIDDRAKEFEEEIDLLQQQLSELDE